HVPPHVARIPAQRRPGPGQPAGPVVEDGAPGDLRQSLPRRREPVRHRDAAARVEPELPGQPAAQAEDLHPVPYAAAWVAGDAERHRIAAEHLRQPAPEHLVDRHPEPVGFVVLQEHQQPRPPVVVGGALGVEPEHLRPRPDQRRRVPQPRKLRLKQRPDNLRKELTRQPYPRHEPTHPADTALSGPSGHLVFLPGPPRPSTTTTMSLCSGPDHGDVTLSWFRTSAGWREDWP